MAHRVEYPKSYKIQLDENNRIQGFGNDDGIGISISFVMPDHSEHFVSERNEEQQKGLRTVSWDFDDAWYEVISAMVEGKKPAEKYKSKYEEVKNFKVPTWSDGANLNKFTKKTALSFSEQWLPILKKASKNKVATVEMASDPEPLGHDLVWAWNEEDGSETAWEYPYSQVLELDFKWQVEKPD